MAFFFSQSTDLKPKKVLIIATRQIGDVLVTTPLITKARALWPEAQLDFLGYRGKLSMLAGNPNITDVIDTSDRPRFREYLSLFFRLFRRYDLALITQPSDRAYLYGWIAARQRIGVLGSHPQNLAQDRKYARQNAWKRAICIYNVTVDYFSQHVISEKIRLLEIFYPNSKDVFNQPVYVTPPAGEPLPASITLQLRKPYVVIHAGPLTAYKRWPLAYWQTLVTWLVTQGWQVVLSASSAKQDLQLNRDIVSLLDERTQAQVIDTAGNLSIPQAGNLIRSAVAYIGVDTSITHLAAACNVPTIALFGPTPPTNFGPWPNCFVGAQPYLLRARSQTVGNVTILQGPGDCVPCRKAGCDDHANSRSACLDLMEPEQVIRALQETLPVS